MLLIIDANWDDGERAKKCHRGAVASIAVGPILGYVAPLPDGSAQWDRIEENRAEPGEFPSMLRSGTSDSPGEARLHVEEAVNEFLNL